ncbi:MAG: 1-phosphofructokinase family hexose kinase [Candidatus Omnitrophica bacterium]|nr:1-phosphofructokinase family hexose kinase [Candidatus Omnitrophota bacterium]
MMTTLTVNPALDLTLEIEGLVVEDVNRVSSFSEDAGGKGINVSKVLRELGCKRLKTLAVLGGRRAERFKNILKRKGIHAASIPIHEETRINVTVFDRKNRHTTKLNQPGPRISSHESRRMIHIIEQAARMSRIFVLAGSLLPDLPSGWYGQLIQKISRAGLYTVLDADGEALRRGIGGRPWLIKPNRFEASRVLGDSLSTEDGMRKGARQLQELGASNVLISLGADGVFYSGEGGQWRGYSVPVRPNSTVGAGDSFLAGFIWRYLKDKNVGEALRMGLACGTHTAMTGAGRLCSKPQIFKLLPKMRVKRIGDDNA